MTTDDASAKKVNPLGKRRLSTKIAGFFKRITKGSHGKKKADTKKETYDMVITALKDFQEAAHTMKDDGSKTKKGGFGLKRRRASKTSEELQAEVCDESGGSGNENVTPQKRPKITRMRSRRPTFRKLLDPECSSILIILLLMLCRVKGDHTR